MGADYDFDLGDADLWERDTDLWEPAVPRWAGFAPIRGQTYPVKNYLKSLGGRWDAAGKTWWVPEEHAADARAVARAGVTPLGWADPYVTVDQATSANLAAGVVRCWECAGRVPARVGGYSCGCKEPLLLK